MRHCTRLQLTLHCKNMLAVPGGMPAALRQSKDYPVLGTNLALAGTSSAASLAHKRKHSLHRQRRRDPAKAKLIPRSVPCLPSDSGGARDAQSSSANVRAGRSGSEVSAWARDRSLPARGLRALHPHHAAAHKAFAVNYKTRRFRVMMTSYLRCDSCDYLIPQLSQHATVFF